MNYITLLGYPEHDDFAKFWPADAQILGKGVLKFHAVIWPGVLLALKLKLPKELYVHGYWHMNGRELSKSTGNVVYPEDLSSLFGVDAARYFNARYLPSYKDGDFTWLKMWNAYENDLVKGLGNVMQRVAMMVEKYLGGSLAEGVPANRHDHNAYHEALKDYRFDRALEWVWSIIDGVNKYLEQTQPWIMAKDEKNMDHVREILLACVADLREIAELLAPFMPQTAELIVKIFGGDFLAKLEGPIFPKVELPGELTAQVVG